MSLRKPGLTDLTYPITEILVPSDDYVLSFMFFSLFFPKVVSWDLGCPLLAKKNILIS